MNDAAPAPIDDSSPSEDRGSLRRAAWRGSLITVGGQGLSAVMRLGSNLVVTRLLVPEDFGVMALVQVFLVGLHLFSDIGVGPNIVQSKRGKDPVFLDTAWTVQVTRGFILFGLACVLGLPLARFYDNPGLAWFLPVAGLSAIAGGFESTRMHTASRDLEFARITILDLVAQAVGAIVMIALAWAFRSVWALVISGIASLVCRTVLSHTLLRGHRHRLAWEPAARKELFEFGRWILVNTALTFLAAQSDRLTLGKLVPVAELGLYSIAANLAGIPRQVIQTLTQKVFYPVAASAMRRADHDPASIRRSRVRLFLVLTPAMALGVATAPAAVAVLYDARYHSVGLLASYLLAGVWLNALCSSYAVVLLAAGQPKYLTWGAAAKTLVFLGLVWPVAPRWGAAGVAVLLSASHVALLVVNMLASRSLGVVTLGADLGLTLLGVALTAAFVGAQRLVMSVTASPAVALVAVLVAGAVVVLGFARRARIA